MAALNRGAREAHSEFFIFTDANAMFTPDTLPNLMSNFADGEVGCVSGRKVLMGSGTEVEANENLYWRYESWIKSLESLLGSTSAATGELLAVRRAAYTFPAQHIINDDFQIVLRTVGQGYRVVYDARAVTVEAGSTSMADEYGRKSRIAAGRWQLTGEVFKLAWRQPGFVFKFFSHKLLRLLVMPLMILVFLANLGAVLSAPPLAAGLSAILLLSPPWGWLLLGGQVLFYLLAGLGAILDRLQVRIKPLYFVYFFVSSQWASLAGMVRYSSGRQTVLWRKVAR
jgi:cellulose synthase/poly-beta-1,6-N-acetylglucosamine synthase-like glycosyltransferase